VFLDVRFSYTLQISLALTQDKIWILVLVFITWQTDVDLSTFFFIISIHDVSTANRIAD